MTLDQRASKQDSDGPRVFKSEGASVTSPVLSDTAENFDPDTERYTPGISSNRDGASRFLHSGIKNMDATTSSSQTISATRNYDAFGNLISSTGVWDGFFGYAGGFGYQEEKDIGLKLLGHRYYDSATGRFLSRDPIGSGRNWNTYCKNSPLNYSDPSGFQERAVTPAEKSAVQGQIDKLRSDGKVTAADVQQKMFNDGDILVDDQMDSNTRAETQTSTLGHASIANNGKQLTELTAALVNKNDPKLQRTKKSRSTIETPFEEYDLNFRGRLFHEYIHTSQQGIWRVFHPTYKKSKHWRKP